MSLPPRKRRALAAVLAAAGLAAACQSAVAQQTLEPAIVGHASASGGFTGGVPYDWDTGFHAQYPGAFLPAGAFDLYGAFGDVPSPDWTAVLAVEAAGPAVRADAAAAQARHEASSGVSRVAVQDLSRGR